ncbi:glutaredoxin 3 [Stappia taiwanensis]|uniref:Glutaredoxin n=1 Tax=Stappia taiwanensis TaxID=992267 RepID=A0A838XJ63_9HYPH|nr:glutaredoxin 3 [Stappia taiwanensis]MBA4611359.1 glutaredoxin 3 [Stappia taiwanensis]GGF00913.1 glutaredoxin 3 [Stappia taiwanensis]
MTVQIYTRQMCGYCSRAKSLFARKGVSFQELDATFQPELRQEMIQRAKGKATFPQIFIGDVHVGGCDELMALDRAGKLDPLLAG